MFIRDKYSPKTFDDVVHNPNIIQMLKNVSKCGNLPHMIFYGKQGSGKKTLIYLLLKSIYGNDVIKLSNKEYNIKGSNSTIKTVNIKQSLYHIVIEPVGTNFDKHVIQQVIKEYAKNKSITTFAEKKPFRVILIKDVDKLSYYAQTSLRRTMEKYSDNCRFLMWTRCISRVIDPIKSRCSCLRIEGPSNHDLIRIYHNINSIEYFNYNLDEMSNIIMKSDNDIRELLWLAELYKFNRTILTDYDIVMNEILTLLKQKNINNIPIIREKVYLILHTNISGNKIFKDLSNFILLDDNITDEQKMKIIKKAAKYEYTFNKSRREIFHFDSFICSILDILSN